LKMEGAAGDGPSPFAAGKVTSEDLSKLGGGGKEGVFNPFNNYAGLMKSELQRQLARQSELRRRSYRVEVRVWVDDSGKLRKSELMGSSGDADTDDLIRQTLSSLPAFSEAPPPNMPQPIRLRIVTSARA
jgi:protein TonB